jgi:hypothetical protein
VDNIKTDLKRDRMRLCGLDWYDPGQGPVGSSCEHRIQPSASIKCWEVLEWLHNWWLLKKDSAPWVSKYWGSAKWAMNFQLPHFLTFMSECSEHLDQRQMKWQEDGKNCIMMSFINLYSLPSIIRMIRMRRAGHEWRTGMHMW